MKGKFNVKFVITVGRNEEGLKNLVDMLVKKYKIRDIEIYESGIIDVASGEKVMDTFEVHCNSDVITLALLRMGPFKTSIRKDGILYIM